MYVCMCVPHTHVCYRWRSEDNLKKSALSSYQVGPRGQTQITRLRGRTSTEQAISLVWGLFFFSIAQWGELLAAQVSSTHMKSQVWG